MPAITKFVFRLLHPKTGAVVAATTVHAESAKSAYDQAMRGLPRHSRAQAFWELEEFPRRSNPSG
jgi:hypothetical protein